MTEFFSGSSDDPTLPTPMLTPHEIERGLGRLQAHANAPLQNSDLHIVDGEIVDFGSGVVHEAGRLALSPADVPYHLPDGTPVDTSYLGGEEYLG